MNVDVQFYIGAICGVFVGMFLYAGNLDHETTDCAKSHNVYSCHLVAVPDEVKP